MVAARQCYHVVHVYQKTAAFQSLAVDPDMPACDRQLRQTAAFKQPNMPKKFVGTYRFGGHAQRYFAF